MSSDGPEKPQTSASCISFILHVTFILNYPGGAFCADTAGVADTVTSGLESGHKIGALHPRHELSSPQGIGDSTRGQHLLPHAL